MKLPPKVINSNVLYQHHTLDIPFDIYLNLPYQKQFFLKYAKCSMQITEKEVCHTWFIVVNNVHIDFVSLNWVNDGISIIRKNCFLWKGMSNGIVTCQ